MSAEDTTNTPAIDLSALEAEVNSMSQEKIAEILLKSRVRQKIQQKKNQNSPKQKEYRKRLYEKNKLLKAAAKRLGIYDKINEEAEAMADEKLKEIESQELVEVGEQEDDTDAS